MGSKTIAKKQHNYEVHYDRDRDLGIKYHDSGYEIFKIVESLLHKAKPSRVSVIAYYKDLRFVRCNYHTT